MLLVRMGRALTISKYQPTNPFLEEDTVVEEEKDKDNTLGGDNWSSLVLL